MGMDKNLVSGSTGMLLLKLLPRVDYFKPMIAPKETA